MVEPQPATKSLFRVTHRFTGVIGHTFATDGLEACHKYGLKVTDAFIIKMKPEHRKDDDGQMRFLYNIKCQTCPFQFAQCCLPRDGECLVKTDAPDWPTWIKNVTEAHLCTFVGKPIDRKDYEKHQVWLTVAQVQDFLDAP